jgi:hypothetical protein
MIFTFPIIPHKKKAWQHPAEKCKILKGATPANCTTRIVCPGSGRLPCYLKKIPGQAGLTEKGDSDVRFP